ncbi:hypothetical protein SDC9_145118 [bioreactor metagenome]|uniref:Uncharacterized protein n=1 Tax=bioreactor metagenome TaxID=1076179 RepID=A0A645E9X5_9ZZZZ
MKHPIINIPGIKRLLGSKESPKLTVESTAPISFATFAKAPANINIITISKILVFPAPLQNISTFSSNFTFLFIINAVKAAARKGISIDTA